MQGRYVSVIIISVDNSCSVKFRSKYVYLYTTLNILAENIPYYNLKIFNEFWFDISVTSYQTS